ncbi:MAG TPA: DUF4190 domain-containing protein, partial [Spirillospora sp.]
TTTGGLIGSPAYMAPEQLDGRGAVPASDVFAWGATVAFAARGEPCFGGGPVPAVINRIINGKPDLSGLDGVLLSAVRAALEKDPERRPSAHSLLERLISGGARVPAAVVPPRIARQTASAKETVPEAIPVAQTDPARSRAASALGPPIADGKAQSLVERQYLQAAQAGDPAAMRSLAALLSRQGRHAEAERWRRHADAADTRPGGRHAPPDRRPPRGDFAGHPTSPRPDAHRYPHSTTTHRSADNGSVPRLNTWALVALVMGILAPFTCGLAAIPAVITGHIGWKQVDLRGERGQGFALTGIVLGWFMITAVVFITAALTPWEG